MGTFYRFDSATAMMITARLAGRAEGRDDVMLPALITYND